MSKKTLLFSALFFLVFFLTSLLVYAPAVWMDRLVAYASSGAVRIAEPRGSFWQGSGVPVINIASLAPSAALEPMPADWQRLSTPVTWRASLHIFSASMALALTSPELRWGQANAHINLSLFGWHLPAGQWTLEPMRFFAAPGALGLLKASGRLKLGWPEMSHDWAAKPELKSGRLAVDMNEFASGLTPIRPLGDYQLTMEPGSSGSIKLSMNSSKDSVLRVTAQGEWGKALSLHGQMQCQRFCDYLVGVMATVGRQNGEVYEFKHP